MLLPKMTPAEMRKILLLDVEEVKERTNNFLPKIWREIIKKKLKHQRKVFFRKITSKNKTKWLVAIIKEKGEKYKTTAHLGCFFHGIKGFRFVDIDLDTLRLDIYNAHFFKRYNERLELGLEDNLELAKRFFQINTGAAYVLNREEVETKVFHICAQIPEGLKFGIENKKDKFIVWNTFISQNEYKGNQEAITEKLKRRVKLKALLGRKDMVQDPYFTEQLIGDLLE